jgi:hypothetical protein
MTSLTGCVGSIIIFFTIAGSISIMGHNGNNKSMHCKEEEKTPLTGSVLGADLDKILGRQIRARVNQRDDKAAPKKNKLGSSRLQPQTHA